MKIKCSFKKSIEASNALCFKTTSTFNELRGHFPRQLKLLRRFQRLGFRMESIEPLCTKLKESYEGCFYKWYTEKFLKGNSITAATECQEMFDDYRACLIVSLPRFFREIVLFVLFFSAKN